MFLISNPFVVLLHLSCKTSSVHLSVQSPNFFHPRKIHKFLIFSQGDFRRIFESSTHGFMVFPLVLPIRLDLIQVKQIPKGAIAFHRDNLMMSRAKVGDSGTSKKSPRKLGGGWLVFLSTFEAFKEIWKSMTVYMEFTVFF